MKTKWGTRLHGLRGQAWWAIRVAEQIHWNLVGRDVVITSGLDGKHSVARSAHYRGDAVDIRIWYTDAAGKTDEFVQQLKLVLGDDYVVLLESTHIHIHWSPVYNPERDGPPGDGDPQLGRTD